MVFGNIFSSSALAGPSPTTILLWLKPRLCSFLKVDFPKIGLKINNNNNRKNTVFSKTARSIFQYLQVQYNIAVHFERFLPNKAANHQNNDLILADWMFFSKTSSVCCLRIEYVSIYTSLPEFYFRWYSMAHKLIGHNLRRRIYLQALVVELAHVPP